MSAPVSGISTVSFIPTSADEAVSITSFVSDADSAFRTQVARARLDSALSFVTTQYERLKSLAVRLVDRISQASTPVTVDSLSSVQKNEVALRKLFSDDGPNLGTSLPEANALYNETVDSGVPLDAPIKTPVLVEQFDRNGETISRSFSWVDGSQAATLSNLQSGGVSSFPGSEVREVVVKDGQNKVIETVQFTIFSDYANRRPTQSSLVSTIGVLNTLVDKTSALLNAELTLAAKVIAEVKKMNLQSLQFQAESNQSINQVRNSRIEIREDALRREGIIRRERELRANQFDRTEGITHAYIAAAEDSGTPNPVPPVSESGITSEAERTRNFKRAQDLIKQTASNRG